MVEVLSLWLTKEEFKPLPVLEHRTPGTLRELLSEERARDQQVFINPLSEGSCMADVSPSVL